MNGILRRWLIGKPLETERAAHEKLPKILALPVFASDAMSSVAYATGEIMAALIAAGTMYFTYTFPIGIAIAVLLVIVTTSYRQTVLAYPGGGGAYIVARENLGILAATVAGAALLIDYVLTVAVSISAGTAALRSLSLTMLGQSFPVVWVALFFLAIVTIINLRGVKESGLVFAIPAYAFVLTVITVIGIGLWKHYLGAGIPLAHSLPDFQAAKTPGALHPVGTVTGLALFALLLHGFASGCAALTGVEAISNGVTAFRQPSSRNAAITMIWMSAILGVLFLGLSFLAVHVHALPENAVVHGQRIQETVVSQIGRMVTQDLPGGPILYVSLQVLTAVILVIAANTAFADFPRLSALIARDSFLPRQLANVGDRLVFDRGIVALAVLSGLLIAWRKGDVHLLIPLYAVGVFLSFTMSQAGMVKRWWSTRSQGWRWKAAVNGFGSVVTFVVLCVILYVKFLHGAWLVAVLIPALVLLFLRIHAHYEAVRYQLSVRDVEPSSVRVPKHAVVVLVPSVTQGVLNSMAYARSMAGEVRGIHIEIDPERTPRLREEWMRFFPDSVLVILSSPYRSVVHPLMEYLDEVDRETPFTQTTVVLPEFVPHRAWQQMLHGQTGMVLKWALLRRKNVVVTNVRYHLGKETVSLRDMLDVRQGNPGNPVSLSR